MTMTNRRVLIFGADGLRPDLIDRALMPNVARLEASGVRFADHHAVYPSHTRVNASTLSTGTTPGRHGIVANTMLVPDATDDHIIDTSQYQHLDALATSDPSGRAQLATTLSDVLRRSGARVAVAGTGSSGSNVLWTFGDRGRMVNPNSAYGIADLYDLREKLGEIPDVAVPNLERNRYVTRAVIELFLHDPANRVITLWLAEPDAALHRFGLGSPEAQAGMKSADDCLGAILDAMTERGIRDQFDVLFVSDHGHSSLRSHKSLRELLIEGQRDLGGYLPEIAVASDFIYTKPGTAEPTVEQLAPLAEWLLAQPWVDVVAGGLDGSERLPGVIALRELWNGQTNPRRPLLAVSPKWNDDANEFGVPGTVSALTTQVALKSSHGSLSPYDMHATLIASGPSFREGLVSAVPTGATDITPTILTILGLELPEAIDGRVLHEALADPTGEAPDREDMVISATNPANQPRGVLLHRVGSTTYVHGSAQSGSV
jgi:predicted AlkP superfamily pyrophosphatase or phosphodiesterase